MGAYRHPRVGLALAVILTSSAFIDAGFAATKPKTIPPFPPSGLVAVKVVVADEAKAEEFYVKFLGMTIGPRYNAAEQSLDWVAPNRGSSLVLVHDDTGHMSASRGTSAFVVVVSDARRVAADLAAAGYKDIGPTISDKAYGSIRINVVDPDGDKIELISRDIEG